MTFWLSCWLEVFETVKHVVEWLCVSINVTSNMAFFVLPTSYFCIKSEVAGYIISTICLPCFFAKKRQHTIDWSFFRCQSEEEKMVNRVAMRQKNDRPAQQRTTWIQRVWTPVAGAGERKLR